MEDISKKVKEIIAQQLSKDLDSINDQSHFVDDLGADSLDVVEMVMAFEEAFGLEIPDEDAEKIQTVQDVINYIKTKKG
jgi:acyl carrier protein